MTNYEEYWEKEFFKEGTRNNKAGQGEISLTPSAFWVH